MEFDDVTLACEDGQQVEAHRVILASSSPFFLGLLKRNNHPHPLIYMKGVKSEDLVAMVDFLYCGEANVYQENLDSFLAVAEELQLKGLMGSGAEEEVEETRNKPKPKKNYSKSEHQSNYSEKDAEENVKPTNHKNATKPEQRRTYTKQEFTIPDISHLVDTV